jgi:PKD repeat protein
MAVFNSVTITFTNDWIATDTLDFITTLGGGTYQGGFWTWVATRSSAFEVTEGTPTGNAGERAAINFEAAFDLDYPTGYVTTVQNTNEVLIQSEVPGEEFGNPHAGGGNTGTMTYVVDNTSGAAPVAAFSGTPLSGEFDLEVTFTDASTNVPTSWAWTFGDGGTSTSQNPVKTYTAAGSYTVGLTATNSTGSDVETKVAYVVVTAPAPPTPQNIAEMLTSSPFYVYTPFVYSTTTALTIELIIWSGDLNVPPTTATETITKIRPTIDYEEFNVDIAKTVRDQITPTPVLDLTSDTQIISNNTDSVKWVTYTASYTDAVETIADITGTLVAIDGYGYMQEGVNPTSPANEVLTSVDFRKVDRTGFILLPFVNNGTITSIDIDSDLGTINDNIVTAVDYNNYSWVKYLCVDVSAATTDDTIVVTVNPSGDTYTYQIIDECIYTPTNVVFKNKFGMFENITMFKKRMESINVSRKQFKNNYISGGTYDISKHQIKDINIVGNETITVNSGFITESENELYRQLLLSEDVYFYEGSAFIPVVVKKSSLEFKTRRNDTVINYTIEFEYAYNVINNI